MQKKKEAFEAAKDAVALDMGSHFVWTVRLINHTAARVQTLKTDICYRQSRGEEVRRGCHCAQIRRQHQQGLSVQGGHTVHH